MTKTPTLQAAILDALTQHGAASAAGLSTVLTSPRRSISAALKRLEEAGQIKRMDLAPTAFCINPSPPAPAPLPRWVASFDYSAAPGWCGESARWDFEAKDIQEAKAKAKAHFKRHPYDPAHGGTLEVYDASHPDEYRWEKVAAARRTKTWRWIA